jgi:hypothetical protein
MNIYTYISMYNDYTLYYILFNTRVHNIYKRPGQPHYLVSGAGPDNPGSHLHEVPRGQAN